MKLFIFLLLILASQSQAATPSTITVSCPQINELTRTSLTNSWANYRYTGQISVDLPAINNVLYLMGDSNAESVDYFYGASWTDRTFLCLYNYLDNPIVMYEGQLDPYVKECYFGKLAVSECHSSNPSDCVMTCELGTNDN
jgi:hypothetical protein